MKERAPLGKLALVFPPAMHPAGPPLGAPSLAGFLRGEGGGSISVRVFDLNLAYHEQALRWLEAG